jgi:hypothetical protein
MRINGPFRRSRRTAQVGVILCFLTATAWLVAEPRDVLEVAGPVATEHIGPKPKAISLGDGSVSSKTEPTATRSRSRSHRGARGYSRPFR